MCWKRHYGCPHSELPYSALTMTLGFFTPALQYLGSLALELWFFVCVFCLWLGGDLGVRPGACHLTAVYVVHFVSQVLR